jgi:hypothetical protein
MSRYGMKVTISLTKNNQWKVPLIFSLLYAVSIIFADTLFPICSNAGDVILLMGVTFATYLVQEDLLEVKTKQF